MRESKYKFVVETDTGIEVTESYYLKDLMDYVNVLSEYSANEILHELQYTGLKDKNLDEIYEGDIVELFDVTMRGSMYGENIVGEVVFFDACFVVDRYDLRSYDCKVIGNIYENPELLYTNLKVTYYKLKHNDGKRQRVSRIFKQR